jgi:small-conductance mechanosensitive channel
LTKKKIKPINFEKVTESDWRGLLALTIIVGGILLILAAMIMNQIAVIAGITPIMALVAQWYFKAKEEAKNGT